MTMNTYFGLQLATIKPVPDIFNFAYHEYNTVKKTALFFKEGCNVTNYLF